MAYFMSLCTEQRIDTYRYRSMVAMLVR